MPSMQASVKELHECQSPTKPDLEYLGMPHAGVYASCKESSRQYRKLYVSKSFNFKGVAKLSMECSFIP